MKINFRNKIRRYKIIFLLLSVLFLISSCGLLGIQRVAVSFKVVVPENTPSEDKTYLYIKSEWPIEDARILMTQTDENTWAATYYLPMHKAVKYKYNRNNSEYKTDEEFVPDNPDTWRTVQLGMSDKSVNDIVQKWRWLNQENPPANISEVVPTENIERGIPFIFGISVLDFFSKEFKDFIPSTYQRISSKQLGEYICISYIPAFFSNGNSLAIINNHIDSYSQDDLAYAFEQAKENNLKIILHLGIEADPANLEKISTDLMSDHPDEWYQKLVRIWQEEISAVAQFAEEHNIEIICLSDQWQTWGQASSSQRAFYNNLIKEAISNIRTVFSGKFFCDAYSNNDDFD